MEHAAKNYSCDKCGQEHSIYILKAGLWRRLGLELTDNLCQACVEELLGRKLRKQDFICRPLEKTASDITDRKWVLTLAEKVQLRRVNAAILKSVALHNGYPDCTAVRIEEQFTFLICKDTAVRCKTDPRWLREEIKPGFIIRFEPPDPD
jgi:hypothetical protein